MAASPPRVLIIAGSDPSGGAGIQADIKTVTSLGGYAAAAITALTVQNTKGVLGVQPLDPKFVKAQIKAVLDDIGADAVKTGMVANKGIAEAVAETLPNDIPIVVDPVMVSTTGDKLLDEDAISAIKTGLIPKARIITPNLPEAEILAGTKIETEDAMKKAAETILGLGAKAVLIKGGHGKDKEILDLLVTENGVYKFPHKRIKTRHTHGTGCTLASAIALGLASGLHVKKAVEMGIDYVVRALACAPGFGAGKGPLGHTLGQSFLHKE